MGVTFGEEFRLAATPDPELWRKLAYLAATDNGSVLTGGLTSPRTLVDSGKSGRDRSFWDTAQLVSLEQQRQAEQIRLLNERLDELDRESLRALREAEERLESIRRSANRTIDGRLVFEDKDGLIRDEQGAEVSRDLIDWSQWNPDADKWEDLQDADLRTQEARAFRAKVVEQRQRLDAGELSADDLADLEASVTDLEASMAEATPAGEPQPLARTTSAAKRYTGPATTDGALALNGHFTGAVTPADPGAGPSGDQFQIPSTPLAPR